MKYGEYLREQKVEEWQSSYLDYDKLKKIIKELEEMHIGDATATGKGTSLSIPRQTNAAGMPTNRQGSSDINQEKFYVVLEQEMRKIEQFTKKQVQEIRQVLQEVESQLPAIGTINPNDEKAVALGALVEKAGENFLKLEKFVNMNFTGFYKILKKHDRRLPNPCKAFYMSRLHDQSWVRGDFSDAILSMSRVYSALRGDVEPEAKESERQDFVRSTRKYWVHTEDISRVKYEILQHLPILLQKTTGSVKTDSQLVNSVYLDNTLMELYHGRLDKTPGAIALRMRWYGTGTPELVFVERKTHRESWAGEVSVKERFTVNEKQVLSLIAGTFDWQTELQRLRDKGKSEDDIREWLSLVQEVIQAINSKQLVPAMRTQYMRTAFQIQNDATVRISLDTNLCMITERTGEQMLGTRWYRDPNVTVPLNEITRFPHAVLEVKLQLQQQGETPEWVTDLINSGMLMEVHKFSKFIHGCAVLLPEEVQSVPYWIDDVTLAPSIAQSGASQLLGDSKQGANSYYQHLLPHDESGAAKAASGAHTHVSVARKRQPAQPVEEDALSSCTSASLWAARSRSAGGVDGCGIEELDEDGNSCYTGGGAGGGAAGSQPCTDYCQSAEDSSCCAWASPMEAEHMTGQKVEPKLFLANERTFIKWLHMAVILSSIAIGVLAFSAGNSQAQYCAVMLLPLALLFVGYALWTFLWRSKLIKTRDANRWDDPYGPVLLTSLLIFALSIQFVMKLTDFLKRI